ncbi:MAG: M48 family metalloprotease [Pseudomonadaceae bacterium]|nr:M48 family metalloprotease [Pseudomonadaceae bacterium]
MFKPTTHLALACTLALAACAQNPATGGSNFNLISDSQARALGEASANSELKRYGLYNPASGATKYVTSLCNKLYASTEVASEPVSCILLDSDVYNAWATPGYINVYRGFLPYVSSEAELAAVLGHEAGHIAARHIHQGVSNQTIAGLIVGLAGVYAGSRMNDGTAAAVTQLGGLAAGATLASFSRGDELEADKLGQRYMQRAGYDPRESANMIDAMLAHETYARAYQTAVTGKPSSGGGLARLFSSHPPSPERYQQAVGSYGAPNGSVTLPQGVQPATTASDPQGRVRYLTAIDGLAYGPKAAWGVAGRNHLTLPKARVRVAIPDGFALMYQEGEEKPQDGAWLGRNPSTGMKMEVRSTAYTPGQNVANLATQLIEGANAATVQRVQLASGGEAYTGTATVFTSPVVGRWLAIGVPEAKRLVVVGFGFPDKAAQVRLEPALMQTLTQTRVLTAAQANAVRPLEIDVKTYRGESLASLAEALPSGVLRQEWFRALNGLTGTETLAKGQLYKTVIDPNR